MDRIKLKVTGEMLQAAMDAADEVEGSIAQQTEASIRAVLDIVERDLCAFTVKPVDTCVQVISGCGHERTG